MWTQTPNAVSCLLSIQILSVLPGLPDIVTPVGGQITDADWAHQ